MKLRSSLLLVVISLALVATRVESARRPHYGGTLHVEIAAVVNSLDPAVPASNPQEAAAKRQIDALLYDHRSADGTFSGVAGSGPFHVATWEAGKRVVLDANDDYRGGRPFVDSIEIDMGRNTRDRLLDLELGRTDLAEIPAQDARQAAERGLHISASRPEQLLALVFIAGRPAVQDERLREALARAIDRSAIVGFILQHEGAPAGSLLPEWSSGTSFLFPTDADSAGAKALASQITGSSSLVLGYDAGDSLEESVAQRIGVNAREAGIEITVQAVTGADGTGGAGPDRDAQLVRLAMPSSDPRTTLADFAAILDPLANVDAVPVPAGASPEQIYSAESALLAGYRVVPLVWLPRVYGLSGRVRDWRVPRPGESWALANVWLDTSGGAAPKKENP